MKGGREDRFLLGFLVAMGTIAVFSVSLILIPIAGPVIAFIVGPYIAGYLGGKYTQAGFTMGFIVGLIWSSMEIILIVMLAESFSLSGSVHVGWGESLIILLIYLFNCVFSMLGGRISSSVHFR